MEKNSVYVLYLDYQKVGDEITEIIKNQHLGELIFKKQKLSLYHKEIYKKTGLQHFFNVTSINELYDVVQQLKNKENIQVFLHHSSVAVVDVASFEVFLEKVMLLNQPICLSDFAEKKPFLFCDFKEIKPFLESLIAIDTPFVELFRDFSAHLETLRKETFYSHIKDLSSLIQFLHSNFEARHFNQIEKDELTITKRSNKIDKIRAEYEYYQHVPEEIKLFFLPTFQFESTNKEASYKLEKLNVPDMAMLWVHGAVKPEEFKTFLNKLFLFVKKRPKRSGKDFFEEKSSAQVLYLEKLKARMEELAAMDAFKTIDAILVNQSEMGGLSQMTAFYEAKINETIKSKKRKPMLAFSHGDLCFSNMLYDKRTQLLKLIDPRGSLNPDELYMDEYYDLAKLSHSVLGNYDFINSGLFDFQTNNQLKIQLEINSHESLSLLQQIFADKVSEEGYDIDLIRIFEASLFLSMLPLHIDNPKKVLAFALNAQKILKTI